MTSIETEPTPVPDMPAAERTPVVICRDVNKWFGRFHALRGISTEIYEGETVVVFGPSGSSKSTFLRTLNRLEPHDAGEIIVVAQHAHQRELARELGVPVEILAQPSSGDLAAGLPNETAIGMSYEQLDRTLVALALGLDDSAAASAASLPRAVIDGVRRSCHLADSRRAMPVRLEPLPPTGDLP